MVLVKRTTNVQETYVGCLEPITGANSLAQQGLYCSYNLYIHELHVWKNDNEEISFTAHILLDNYEKHNNYRIINEIKEKLAVYDIFHMTVQIENTGINVH